MKYKINIETNKQIQNECKNQSEMSQNRLEIYNPYPKHYNGL